MSAFQNCASLTVADFPACTSINNNAFSGCTKLNTISFPQITTITTTTLNGLTSLQTAYFPKITYLNSTSGFAAKSYLQNLTILGRSTSTIYASTFKGCWRLTSLTILYSSGVAPLAAATAFTSTPISTYTTQTGGVRGSIYVPASLVSAYKSATNWATFSSQITAIPE